MKMLVLGANGLLGSNVIKEGQERGFDIVGTYHSKKPNFEIQLTQFDVRNEEQLDNLLQDHQPTTVVNCAAMTDVDACEERLKQAYAVNRDAPKLLAERCADQNINFVHISTDYVFDGTTDSPYNESATPNPIQEYGKSKLGGEQEVDQTIENVLILRLSFVYGIHHGLNKLTGFPAWVIDRAKNGEETSLFTDQRISPTRAGQAAEVILDLLKIEQRGLYHIACSSCVTPYEFGCKILNRVNADQGLLSKGMQENIDRRAARPTNTCLDVSKLEKSLNRPQPSLTDDIDDIAEIL